MTPTWLDSDFRVPVQAPIQGDASNRSADLLEAVVKQHQVETARRYEKRDVTGDAIPETFCNVFARDVCRALGVPLPEGMKANQLVEWLQGPEGRKRGWEQGTRHVAAAMADQGQVALAAWFNRTGGPGHIAVVLPSHGERGLFIAQAGSRNFVREQLERGFGSLPVSYFVHP